MTSSSEAPRSSSSCARWHTTTPSHPILSLLTTFLFSFFLVPSSPSFHSVHSNLSVPSLLISFTTSKLVSQWGLLLWAAIDWVEVSRSTWHKIRHSGDVLPSQFLGIIPKKLNLTQVFYWREGEGQQEAASVWTCIWILCTVNVRHLTSITINSSYLLQ